MASSGSGSVFTRWTVAMHWLRPSAVCQRYPQKSALPIFTSTSLFPASSKTFTPIR